MHLRFGFPPSDEVNIPRKHSTASISDISIPALSLTRLRKYTSCAIHMHSGKSYNPVSCERAQVTPLIGPPLWFWTRATSNPPLCRTHWNVQKKKKKKKRRKNFKDSWIWDIRVALIVDFLTRSRTRSLWFWWWWRWWWWWWQDPVLTRLLKTENLYSSWSRLCIVCL